MKVSLIVAIAANNAIGKDNNLIWHLPNDMKYFKNTTLNHHIITGRKNYISIPKKFRPLANRTNIVLTRNSGFKEPECIIKNSIEEAIDFAKNNNENELFIIGGGQIYEEVLSKKLIDKMYITHVHAEFDADTFFPVIDKNNWKIISKEDYNADDKHAYPYSFVVYEKIN